MEIVIKDLKCISYYQYLSSNKRYLTKRGKEYKKCFIEQLDKQILEKGYSIL